MCLRISMITALGFIALFVAALGAASVAPGAKPGIELVRQDGTVLCGTSMTVTGTGTVLQVHGVAITTPADQIGGLRPVVQCP